jgi:cytochrome b involved in lipid metabolism
MAQVATHNTASNCWATINGNVYNLTSWISQHPGGEAPILGLCGKDGTSAFESQHGNNGRANAELATLKIGTLAQ